MAPNYGHNLMAWSHGSTALIKSRNLVFVGLVAALLLSTGCSVMPGSHIKDNNSNWFNDEAEQRDAQEDLSSLIRVKPISGLQDVPELHELPPSLEAPLTSPTDYYDYVVGPGDVLNITVWDHPELTIPAGSERSPSDAGNWVHNDGSIFYPYVGIIEVEGLKVTEIRDLITRRLSRYIEKPQVDVTVAAFRSQKVYVSGGVNQPGAYAVTNVPMRLLDAVNAAKGLSDNADWRNVLLTREGEEYRLSLKAVYELGDRRYNVLLKKDDVVHVSRDDDNKVFVLGEVKQAQALPMGRNGLSLAEALAESGGINELQANASGIFVLRRAMEEGERYIDLYQLDARNAAALILADEFTLAERDIVYVTAAPITRWNRVISQLMPTVQAVYYGSLASKNVKELDN